MEVEFRSGINIDTLRIVDTLYGTISHLNTYKKGLILLDNLELIDPIDAYRAIYFPRIKGINYRKTIKELNKIDNSIKFSTSINQKIEDITSKKNAFLIRKFVNENYKVIKINEKKIIKLIKLSITTLTEIFPKIVVPEKLNIRLTHYGSMGSYNTKNEQDTAYFFFRSDLDLSYLIYTIINKLIVINYNFSQIEIGDSEVWAMKQFLADFILTKTSLSKIFPNFKPLFPLTFYSNSTLDLLSYSQAYIDDIILTNSKFLSLKSDKIYIESKKKYINNLSFNEEIVLKLLIKNYFNTITIFEIMDALYGKRSTEKFSISYVTKLIHSIKFKLMANGLYSDLIANKRGEGYSLIA